MTIEKIHSRWVVDSRGNPTVEVDVTIRGGYVGRASVPSGVSVAISEAAELRDQSRRFGGKGVSKALNIIEHTIAPVVIGMAADNQEELDARLCSLDGTKDKSHLGSNTILGVSMATAKAVALSRRVPFYRYVAHLAGHNKLELPMPLVNVLDGGAHAFNSTDIQEFMIIPRSAHDIHSAIRISMEIFHELGCLLKDKGLAVSVGDEGGWAPFKISSNNQALVYIMQAIEKAGYRAGEDVVIALDFAASQLYKNGRYDLKLDKKQLGARAMMDWYQKLIDDFPIVSLEDPLREEAWGDWQALNKRLQNKMQLVGDDLIATNEHRLLKAIQLRAANTVLIKPNQIGTLTETIHAAALAKANGWRTIIAGRAGETEDTSIAHLAVGLKVGQIKAGSVSRGERTAKYNELLRICESLRSEKITSGLF